MQLGGYQVREPWNKQLLRLCAWASHPIALDRRRATGQFEAVRLADDGVLGDAEPPADLGRWVPLIPEFPQSGNRLIVPIKSAGVSAHVDLLGVWVSLGLPSQPPATGFGLPNAATASLAGITARACRTWPSAMTSRPVWKPCRMYSYRRRVVCLIPGG